MLSKKMMVAELFAFYGELLTDKQKDILTLYCLDDYSLGEIAEDLSISRQGVHDTVKRATKTLEDYESKLGLMDKFNKNNLLLNDIQLKMMNLSQIVDGDSEVLRKEVKNVIGIVTRDIDEMIE
ncbi:DNA-binding protein [Acidaminobacter sp. JC074]|uniref:YlxM family DNA-binding protein n=1 Tax=Acidaminobacter sp. JC074 TaxID=2530199 RepID=UPI001F0FA0D4|nr:YlxM family DNA-binding protein [Acidaminobacter sp. JC074]MCH4888331.1 DNA-binding protein [Acidaminobacter sp. JC074]